MRLIIVGCEYTGKSTLAHALVEWGQQHDIRFHLDDHFTIPDQQMVKDPAEWRLMTQLPPALKERYQRFQIYYHIHLLHEWDDIVLTGYHIEEHIYGARYYYPSEAHWLNYSRRIEKDLPEDTILLLLTSRPEVIHHRMQASPHEFQVVPPEDVEEVQRQFELEFNRSWLRRKMRLDTSDLAPTDLLPAFLRRVRPHLNARDLLRYPAG